MSEQPTQTPATQTPPAPTPDGQHQAPEHHYHHEQEKTELEKWLNAALTKMEPYSNQILLGFIVVAVLVVSVTFVIRSTSSSNSAEWETFVGYDTPEDFQKLAEEKGGSSVGAWALLQAGKGFLQEGMRNALTNRSVSDARLNEAVAAFEKLLKEGNASDRAREEALFGLATAREVLNGDDPSSAIEAYKKLVDEFEDSTHVAWANQRIQELESSTSQNFYAWFRKQDPKPSDRQLPSDLMRSLSETEGAETEPDLLEDPKMDLPPTGVGEKNENEVPTLDELKDQEEKKGDKPAKPFPAPTEKMTEKPEAPAEKPETPQAAPEEPAKPKADEPKATEEKKEEPAPPAEAPKAEEAAKPAAEPAPEKPAEEEPAEPAPAEKPADEK